jgi:hypothetical protein
LTFFRQHTSPYTIFYRDQLKKPAAFFAKHCALLDFSVSEALFFID